MTLPILIADSDDSCHRNWGLRANSQADTRKQKRLSVNVLFFRITVVNGLDNMVVALSVYLAT